LASQEILYNRDVWFYGLWYTVFQWCAFLQLHISFKLVPEIVQCCQPQSEVIWWLARDAVCSVTSVQLLGHSLRQWLLLLVSMTLTVNCESKCLLWFILLLCCCFVIVNIINIGSFLTLLKISIFHVSLIILIILQSVDEQLSPVREVTVGAVGLCGDKRIISSYCMDLYGPMKSMFSWDLVLPFIFCSLRFWGWFLISVVLNVLCSFSSISVIISIILVMIGHVREIAHMYQYAVPTSEDVEIEYYIKTV